jgi:hypothetical protein
MIEPTKLEYYCEIMHYAYEEAAIIAGWQTNPRSTVPWSEVPEANKYTMRVAVNALLEQVKSDFVSEAEKELTS